jgi:tetratricopeptide (TPR) repeat protein
MTFYLRIEQMTYAFDAFLTLGQLYQQERDTNNAISCFKSALNYDPENIEALLLLGTAQFEANMFGITIKITPFSPLCFILYLFKEPRGRERWRTKSLILFKKC